MNNVGTPRDFWEQGKRGIYFRRTGNQKTNFEGNKDNIGDQGTLENDIFSILWEHGNRPIYFRGTRELVLPW